MFKRLIFALLFLSCWPGLAAANAFVGTKVGLMSVSFDNDAVEDDPGNAGVILGYAFTSFIPALSLELDITRSVAPGRVANADLSVETQGLYLSYRSSGTVYFKGRLGFMDASLTGNLAEDEGGETYGVGLGWRRNVIALELDYTSIDDDVSYSSIGVIYHF